MYCENCGKQVNTGVKFCPYCGFNLMSPDKNKEEPQLKQDKKEPLSVATVAGTVSFGIVGIIQTILHYLGWGGVIFGVIAFIFGNTARGKELLLSGIGLLALKYVLGFIFLGSVVALKKIKEGSDKKSFKTWYLPFLIGFVPGFILARSVLGSDSVLMAMIEGVMGALFGNLSVYLFNKILKRKTSTANILYIIASILLVGGVVFGAGYLISRDEPTSTPTPQTWRDLIEVPSSLGTFTVPTPTPFKGRLSDLLKRTPLPTSVPTPTPVPLTGTFLAGYIISTSNLHLPGVSIVLSRNGINYGAVATTNSSYRIDGLIAGENYTLSIKLPMDYILDTTVDEPMSVGAFNGNLPYWNPGMTNGSVVNIHWSGENSLWIYTKPSE